VVGACGWQPGTAHRAAEHGIPADRCAREIVAILKSFYAARARHLNANPLY
jgi:hypothetical protein